MDRLVIVILNTEAVSFMDFIYTILDSLAAQGLDIRRSMSAQWLGIPLWQYLLAFILVLGSLFGRKAATFLLNRYVLPLVRNLGANNAHRVIETLIPPATALFVIFGVYAALQVLMLPVEGRPGIEFLTPEFLTQTFQVALAVIIVLSVMRLVDLLGVILLERAKDDEIPVEAPIIPLLRKSVKIFVGLVGGLLIIQHLGYPIASLLGGLGIGGLAVALAAQDTLANVFGSIIVFTDKPFKVGDWIEVGEHDGFVESIGFRSTRIRTWPKTLVTIPNKELANTRIENWSAMPIRRVSFTLWVGYRGATPEKIQKLIERLTTLLTEHPGVDQTYHHAFFHEFAEHGLGIYLYYFTRSTVWKEHLTVRQEINLEAMRILDDLGLTLGIPARAVSIEDGNQAAESMPGTLPNPGHHPQGTGPRN